jgi:hypothetical protein
MSLYTTPEPDWDAPAETMERGERIAIVGSRGYPRLDLVRRYIQSLPANTTIISGTRAPDDRPDEAITDVDSCAIRAAERRGLAVQVYPADWREGRGAGLARNTLIVEAADKVLAFWDGRSRGTADTMRKARAAGKRLAIVGPNGQIVSVPDGKKMEAPG